MEKRRWLNGRRQEENEKENLDSMRSISDGKFLAGWTGFKNCIKCNNEFLASSGSQKICQSCRKCEYCHKNLKYSHKRFCNNSCAGKWKFKNSPKVRKALELGRDFTPERLENLSKMAKMRAGIPRPHLRDKNNPNWKGGRKSYRQERHMAMGRIEYIAWRKSVYERDNYACQICNARSTYLNAHHIKSWKDYEHLRYDLDNGITLCKDCHIKIHTGKLDLDKRTI